MQIEKPLLFSKKENKRGLVQIYPGRVIF